MDNDFEIKVSHSKLLEELNRANPSRNLEKKDINIVAVSKGFDCGIIRKAFEKGYRHFGENRVKEALSKKEKLDNSITDSIHWHFIGHLQSNKVRHAIDEFKLVHSMDRNSLIDEFQKRLSRNDLTQDVLMQVNVSREESKYGVVPEKAQEQLNYMLKFDSLNVRGLMTIAPYTDDSDRLRETFEKCRFLRDQLEDNLNTTLPELSMGMTNDYEFAVQEGSTMLRLGRKIFGPRPDN